MVRVEYPGAAASHPARSNATLYTLGQRDLRLTGLVEADPWVVAGEADGFGGDVRMIPEADRPPRNASELRLMPSSTPPAVTPCALERVMPGDESLFAASSAISIMTRKPGARFARRSLPKIFPFHIVVTERFGH
jgi:hypothetical protein